MKKITKLMLFTAALVACVNVASAQATIDFETVGNTWTWSTFEFNPQWSIVANPNPSGINTSATVGKLVVATTDQRWAGVECAYGQFGPFEITASNHIIKIMVYKDVISPVGVKLAAVDGWSKGEKKVTNTKINEWEELTFDFLDFIDPGQPSPYHQIIFFPDYPDATRSAVSVSYIDNISFPGALPETITLSKSALTIASQAGSTNTFDIVTDLNWSLTSNQTWLTASSESGSGNATITLTATVNTSAASRTATVTVTASDESTKTITVTQSGAAIAAAPTPTLPAANVKSVFSDAYTPVTATYQNWHGTVMTEVATANPADIVKHISSTCCFGYEFADKNMSSMTKLHVDIFPITLTSMTFGIVSGGDRNKSFTLTPNQWNSIDITLADLSGADLANVAQVGFWNLNGTFYMDNLLFYSGTYTVSTGIRNGANENGITSFPSVVTDMFTVSADATIERLDILSLVGQLIHTESINDNTKTIDLSNLNPGNYLVRIQLANGQFVTRKIVKRNF
jgi:hypothetical protein